MGEKPEEGGFRRDLKREVLEAAQREVLRRVESLECPVHGKRPVKRAESHAPGKVDFNFDCCCNTLAEMIQKELT